MNYRSAVGPERAYDILGGLQFTLLYLLGLRDYHKLCDVGCGSLRAGRLFIPYLRPGNYYGVEPYQQLVELGIEEELGKSIVSVKAPHFLHDDDFNLNTFGVTFDYILAQSIFSHAACHQIEKCLSEVAKALAWDGTLVATYWPTCPGELDYAGDEWVGNGKTAHYCKETMQEMVKDAGLTMRPLKFPHPWGQKWLLITLLGCKHPPIYASLYDAVDSVVDVVR